LFDSFIAKKRKHKSTTFFSFDHQKMCFYDVSYPKINTNAVPK